jgi:hypothetical protein
MTRRVLVQCGISAAFVGAISVAKPPYAALWKSSIFRVQLVSGFHLGKIWATIYKSLILNA